MVARGRGELHGAHALNRLLLLFHAFDDEPCQHSQPDDRREEEHHDKNIHHVRPNAFEASLLNDAALYNTLEQQGSTRACVRACVRAGWLVTTKVSRMMQHQMDTDSMRLSWVPRR